MIKGGERGLECVEVRLQDTCPDDQLHRLSSSPTSRKRGWAKRTFIITYDTVPGMILYVASV